MKPNHFFPLGIILACAFLLISCSSYSEKHEIKEAEKFSVVEFHEDYKKERTIFDLSINKDDSKKLNSIFRKHNSGIYLKDDIIPESFSDYKNSDILFKLHDIRTRYALVGYDNDKNIVIINFFWMRDPFFIQIRFENNLIKHDIEEFFTKEERKTLKEIIPEWKDPLLFKRNIQNPDLNKLFKSE